MPKSSAAITVPFTGRSGLERNVPVEPDPVKWLLVYRDRSRYRVHSVHSSPDECNAWMRCLERDGKDCIVVDVDSDIVSESFTSRP